MRNFKGFTLLDMMIAVAIIILLLSIFLPGISRMRQNAKATRMKAELTSIYKAITMYQGYTGRFPTDWNELNDYITIPNVEDKYELNTNYGGVK